MKSAIVVIGRNEAENLDRCIQSARRQSDAVIYVDSGSSDNSLELARLSGADVVELDSASPYTAARARNAGFQLALTRNPVLERVQFVDADCELVEGWLDAAERAMENAPDVAAVCGRRRERFPETSRFQKLCDMEWHCPPGEATSFGGDALVRVAAFRQVGGFEPTLIAGEEPELSLRLRRKGWKILRLNAAMTWHDAKITRFRQWWQRATRSGYAYAEGAWLHGSEAERYCVRESLSIWLWGLLLPVGVMSAAFVRPVAALVVATLYPLQVTRIYRQLRQRGFTFPDAFLYARFCVLGKLPQLLGQIQFYASKLTGRRRGLIEYKTAASNTRRCE